MTEPLVVIPGFMQDARAFMPQIVAIGKERQVILLPLTGGDTIEQISQHWARHLPPSFAILAHGLGGDLALDLLRRMPERISRMGLIGTDPLSEGPSGAALREARLVAARAGRLAEALAEDLPRDALADMPWRDEVMDLVQDMALGLGLPIYERHIRLMQRRPDHQKTLRRVKIPALVLTGAKDSIVPPRRAEFLADLMPFGQVQRIQDAGHLPQLEQPELVTAAFRAFLAGPLLLR